MGTEQLELTPLFGNSRTFIGGILWGIPGMILASTDFWRMTKEIFRSLICFKQLSYLMEDGLCP